MKQEISNCKNCLCLTCTTFDCRNCEYCMSINYGNKKTECTEMNK
jgi:hypothetical protein